MKIHRKKSVLNHNNEYKKNTENIVKTNKITLQDFVNYSVKILQGQTKFFEYIMHFKTLRC
jgi:hypothetical protein